VAALLASSDRNDYIKSLELIRGLDFDVIVPGRRLSIGATTVPPIRATSGGASMGF
jgi:hypothetical protein